jgi:hypothetical protein
MPLVTDCDGRAFAIAMLRKLSATSACARGSIEREFRPRGKAQVLITLPFADALRDRGTRAAEMGFHAVLTDMLAVTLNGSVPDADFYEQFVDGAAMDADFGRFLIAAGVSA